MLKSKTPATKKVFETNGGRTTEITQPVAIRTSPVCWGIPMDEVVFSEWVKNFTKLPVMLWDTVCTTQSTYLIQARNSIHKNFLNTTDEWLVMLDSDVLPPPDFVTRLMASGKPIIGGWYHMKTGTFGPAVYEDGHAEKDGIWYWKNFDKPGTGIQKVGAIGAGCLLMHRSVAEQLGEHPYGTYSGGEDMVLCRLLKEKGIDLYVDWSVACAHAGVGII